MDTDDYAFLTRWRVRGTAQEVSDTLSDAEALSRWWPAVYLAVQEVEPGEPGGVGRVVDLHTRGGLPYTLRWSFRVTESREPYGFTLEAWGDFLGEGVWTFAEDGDYVDITYDWRISPRSRSCGASRAHCGPSSPPTIAGRWHAARRACGSSSSVVALLERRRRAAPHPAPPARRHSRSRQARSRWPCWDSLSCARDSALRQPAGDRS